MICFINVRIKPDYRRCILKIWPDLCDGLQIGFQPFIKFFTIAGDDAGKVPVLSHFIDPDISEKTTLRLQGVVLVFFPCYTPLTIASVLKKTGSKSEKGGSYGTVGNTTSL